MFSLQKRLLFYLLITLTFSRWLTKIKSLIVCQNPIFGCMLFPNWCWPLILAQSCCNLTFIRRRRRKRKRNKTRVVWQYYFPCLFIRLTIVHLCPLLFLFFQSSSNLISVRIFVLGRRQTCVCLFFQAILYHLHFCLLVLYHFDVHLFFTFQFFSFRCCWCVVSFHPPSCSSNVATTNAFHLLFRQAHPCVCVCVCVCVLSSPSSWTHHSCVYVLDCLPASQ